MNLLKIKEVICAESFLVKPSEEELKVLDKKTREIIKILSDNLKKAKINADVFVGGSFAKGTLIKKDKYDVDIFVRFDVKYGNNKISGLLKKVVPKTAKKIHGSRDYFSISEGNLTFEIIPVMKIKNPSEAENITDLSYFHVKYIKNKINKNKKLAGEIRLAKAFAYYQNCYGAESYINGFSGYGVELVVCAYGSFIRFISEVAKFDLKKDKRAK
ncbi:MAG: nucleotidyltransferase domain-containing protein, partial [archaeon]|nr:nucleotidyltransferase domain-containing protein [archaeon]